MQPQIVDLNSVVTRTGKLLLHLIGEDVDFQTITSPDLNKVLADEGQIEQVLVNLAVNARDAMPKGGKLTIRTDNVELDEEYCRLHMQVSPGRYVMIAVTDSGHGMTDEVKSRLFEPFFTTKEQGKGTGLGLATVYGIVKQSGGSIWIYSEVGLGTTFKVYLPAVVNAQEQPHEAYTTGPQVNGSATILLVEDEPVVRQMTRQVLDRCGYKVLEADGADAARSICRNHLSGIDLMLTDVVMPKVNGRELAGELQSQYPDMKVVYMSGYTDDVILPYGIRSGEIAFIEKPFTPKTLSLKLQEVLNGSAIL
jgi:CheY-like chemotaxis protein